MLNVLVRAEGGGDAMWRPEVSGGDVALLRVPIAAFGDGSREPRRLALSPAAEPGGDELVVPQPLRRRPCPLRRRRLRQRARRHGRRSSSRRCAAGRSAELPLAHAVDRIEVLGRDAMVVGGGADDGLGFTAIELAAAAAAASATSIILPDAVGGRDPQPRLLLPARPGRPTAPRALLGLPVARAGRSGATAASSAARRRCCSCAATTAASRRPASSPPQVARRRRRRLPGLLRRLVRQCPADLPRRPHLRPARLRAGRRRHRGAQIREIRRLNYAPSGRAIS